MGLGDFVVANAIIRHFTQTHNVLIACKPQNVPSVQWMVRGLPVALLQGDDALADKLAIVAKRRGHDVLKLGMFNDGPFDEKIWDQEFFRQAGIPFEKRWSEWKAERDLSRELKPTRKEYALIHDDPKRGFVIDAKRLPSNLPIDLIEPGWTDNIFDWLTIIENATELHLIDSCFAILADSLPNLKCKRFVIHQYARPKGLMPTYRFPVEILR